MLNCVQITCMEEPQNIRRYNVYDGEKFLASVLLYDAPNELKTEATILATSGKIGEPIHFCTIFPKY